MENPSPAQEDPENPPPFWCHICKVTCASAVNLQSHFLGAKHKRAEEALEENQQGETEDQAKPQESLQVQIDACQNTEPALGLEFIYEYRSHGYNRYECRLCNCFLNRTHMFMHIVGNRHRIQYLADHHPSLGINNTSVLNKRGKKLKKLREVCVQVEEEYGRRQINVVKEDDKVFTSDDPALLAPLCVNYKPEVKKMDFTNDDFMDVEKKPAVEEDVVTFQKLKAEHDASQRKQEIARERRLQLAAGGPVRDLEGEPVKDQTGAPEKDQAGGPAKDQAGGPEKDHEENKENETYDSDADDTERKPELDAFSSPKEVFEYLDNFEVFELRHVHYLMKVAEKLKKVLDRHKKKMESTTNAQDGNDNQPSLTNQETLTKYQGQEGPTVPPEGSVPQLEYEEETYTEPTMESDQAVELSADQQGKKNPSAFLGVDSRNSNKKLSFRIAGTPVEKKSLVSTEVLSNMQYEFATKSNPNRMMAASVDDKSLSEVPTPSVQPAMEKTRDAWEQRFPNEGSTTVAPTRAAYPHELLGNSAGSVTTQASNVHDPASSFNSGFDGTRDVQEQRFSSSRLGNPGTSMAQPRHPMSKLPDRAGGASLKGPLPNEGPSVVSPHRASYPHERLGNPAGSVPNRASNEPFKNAGGFPPPSAQNTQEWMRNSAPLYPSREPMRTSAGSVPNQAWKEPFKNTDGFPPPKPPHTQERMRNSAPTYPPREPMRTSAGSLPNRASNEPFKNDAFPPPNTQEHMRNSAPMYPPWEPMRTSTGSVPGFPPKDPNTQERMRNSAPMYPPREPMRTSPGSVPNRTSNEPFKNDGFPPPNTQEHMRNSAPMYPPREPMRTSAGSVPNWASNEPFKNAGGFPPQNAQGRIRNSAPPYPPQEPMRTSAGSGFPRAPNSQEMLKNAAGFSGLRPPDSYRHLGSPAGLAPARAPFPPPLKAAPRAAPPTFPNDDVTAKFFDSLKDMDIAEVTATLNKIATTNPAFRGINVPSLVRYLMDTGKIRSSSNRPGNV